MGIRHVFAGFRHRGSILKAGVMNAALRRRGDGSLQKSDVHANRKTAPLLSSLCFSSILFREVFLSLSLLSFSCKLTRSLKLSVNER